MNNNIRGYNPLYRVILTAAATLVFAGIFISTFLIYAPSALGSVTVNVVDEVLPGSLSGWTVGDSGGNPIFTYQEITSPYDSSTAIRTSVVGDTVALCPSQYVSNTYEWGGNTSYTNLQAYLTFSSTMDEYNFPYVYVQLYDAADNQLGYQVYYGKGVISGHYAGIASADPSHYTELSAAEGDMVMDLSRMGSDIDFHHFTLTLSNYACIGENSVTFDYLRIVNGTDNTEPSNAAPVATDDSFTVEAGQTHVGQVAGTDADTDPLTFELVDDSLHGTLQLISDGSFNYLADSNYAGEDSFTFKAYDGQEYSAEATVGITVTAPEPAKVIKLLVYNPNVKGPNNESCKGDYGALPYQYLEDNDVEVTFWCNGTVVDASVLADYDVIYVGRARSSATYINSTDLKNWVSTGGGAILESCGDSFEPGTTDIIWPGIHDLFGYNNCPEIESSDNAGGGPLNKLIDHPIWDGVTGPVGDSSDGLFDSELNDSCIGTGVKIGTAGASAQSPMVNEFGAGRTYSGVLVNYTLNENSQRYFLNVVDWVAQEGRDRDTTAPVITLLGEADVRVNVGETYVDAGATAEDNVDGAVEVETTGIVDTSIPGTYQLTYSAEDSSGNVATENRTVRVVEPDRSGGSSGNATRVGERRINKAPDPQGSVLGAQTSDRLEQIRQIKLQLIRILTLYIELLKKNQV